MARTWNVLLHGRVIFKGGFYEREGAERYARNLSRQRPKSTITVVQIVTQYIGVPGKFEVGE